MVDLNEVNRRMKARKLDIKDLSRLSGKHPKTVRNFIETGTGTPRTTQRILGALGILDDGRKRKAS